jgi:hypothetical protein
MTLLENILSTVLLKASLTFYADSESVALCQQPSIEGPLANWIVMAVGTPFEGDRLDLQEGLDF